jgi:hypothetical protein
MWPLACPGLFAKNIPFCGRTCFFLTPRALEFMLAIMKRLLDDPEASMSDVVYETYHATLHRWHGFIASSAFNVRRCHCSHSSSNSGQQAAPAAAAAVYVCWTRQQKQAPVVAAPCQLACAQQQFAVNFHLNSGSTHAACRVTHHQPTYCSLVPSIRSTCLPAQSCV